MTYLTRAEHWAIERKFRHDAFIRRLRAPKLRRRKKTAMRLGVSVAEVRFSVSLGIGTKVLDRRLAKAAAKARHFILGFSEPEGDGDLWRYL